MHLDREQCSRPAAHRAFDFWLGSWAVRGRHGTLEGYHNVTSVFGGCVVQENFVSAQDDQAGSSFGTYDRIKHRRHHFRVDSYGKNLVLEGSSLRGKLRMTGYRVNRDGQNALERTTWSALPDERVHKVWGYSLDRGRTWKLRFEGFYKHNSAHLRSADTYYVAVPPARSSHS